MRSYFLLNKICCLFLFISLGIFKLQGQLIMPNDRNYFNDEAYENLKRALSLSAVVQNKEVIVGATFEEYQNYGCNLHQLQMNSKGEINVLYTLRLSASTDQFGIGYNFFNGSQWGKIPTNYLYPIHVFHPTINEFEDGSQVVIGNPLDGTPLKILSRKSISDTFILKNIPNSDILAYHQAIVGGSNNQTLHLVGTSLLPFKGIGFAPFYFRSQNKGKSWAKTRMLLPGLDSNDVKEFYAYSTYTQIASKGNRVAIGLFNYFNDILVYISEDNGNTWEKRIINKFPKKRYIYDQGIDSTLLPRIPGFDPGYIFTSGGQGTLLFDNNQKLHLVFDGIYYRDAIANDNRSEIPYCSTGLYYWNESMKAETSIRITGIPDMNKNQNIDVDCIGEPFGGYYPVNSIVNWPSIAFDKNNIMYICYSSLREGTDYISDVNQLQYRHVFIQYSMNEGKNWSEPYDVINKDLINLPNLTNKIEATYPQLNPSIDSTVSILYLRDFLPGSAGYYNHGSAQSNVMFMSFDKNILFNVTHSTDIQNEEIISIVPNPARTYIDINLKNKNRSIQDINCFSNDGALVFNYKFSKNLNAQKMDISSLNPGIYYLQFQFTDHMEYHKFVKI